MSLPAARFATPTARLGAILLAATTTLCLADLAASSGSIDLRRYQDWLVRGPRATLPGLWPSARVSVQLGARVHRRGPRLEVRAGGAPARLSPGLAGVQLAELEGSADPEGRLQLRGSPKGSVSLARAAFRQHGPRGIPPLRLLAYLLLAGLGCAWGRILDRDAGGLWGGAVVSLAASVGLLCGSRVQLVAFLPWALLLMGLGLLVDSLGLRAGLAARPAAFVALVWLLRAGVALQPGFPSIDAAFHSENVARFQAGEVIRSTAPGPAGRDVAVPYPPALYALLAPLDGIGWPTPQFPVQLLLALLEGTLPLLLFPLARAAGASARAAALAACILAALPECVLVLGKGIAANVLGQWVTLALLLALLRRAHPVALAGLFALAFLSHLGASLLLLGLVGCWTLHELRTGSASSATRVLLCAAVGAALSWLVYYREVAGLTLELLGGIASRAVGPADAFLGVRWYRVGKTLQDLLLKFGAAPLAAAAAVLTRRDVAPGLKGLLGAWFVAGAWFGLVAILTPIPLRFEYFLGPAVALAAGLGAEGWSRRRRRLVLAVPLLVQALLAAFLWARRFRLISVIMESPRWPFPFRL
jgi:hypothetical protein